MKARREKKKSGRKNKPDLGRAMFMVLLEEGHLHGLGEVSGPDGVEIHTGGVF
jgi:hypothetical protein